MSRRKRKAAKNFNPFVIKPKTSRKKKVLKGAAVGTVVLAGISALTKKRDQS